MWVIQGPFDGEESGAIDFKKIKLLRTKREYTFGRKGTPLLVNSKKISGEHAVFHVGEFDAEDPTAVPTLTFRSFKKTFGLLRGESDTTKDAGYVQELQDGDEIVIVNIVHIKIRWLRVCCYTGTPSALLSECASLGINLTSQPSADANYHLTPTLTATASLAASLISSTQFVKPEWLQDLVKLGDGAHSLPSATLAKYRPKLAANLEQRHQVHSVWDPDEGRLRIFRDLRFLCVGEKAREVPLDLRQMISRGDGTLESFDVHLGVDKFRQAISRGKSKEGKKLVVVGDEVTLAAAVGEDVLKEFVEEAKQSGLAFHPPDALVESVLDTDTSRLETQALKGKARSASPIVIDEEPAPAPLRPKRLARREPSREPSAQPSETPASQVAQPQIVRLKRLKRNPAPDTSSILNGPPDLGEASAPKPPSITQATPGRPVRLKRRTRQGSAEPNSLDAVEESFEVPDSVKEPPLKRFKALFEASDPSNLGTMSSAAILDSQYNDDAFGGGSIAAGTASQTQMETMTQSKGRSAPSLSALREEEEESSSLTLELGTRAAATRKRARVGEDDDGDVDMDRANGRPPLKRRATGASLSESVEAEVSAPPNAQPNTTSKAPPSRASSVVASGSNAAASSSKNKSKPKFAGAVAGKPDEDSAFLKAVASTKRGKKKEDDFDREFNKLKISKPDLAPVEDEPEKEWAVLAEFGDDSGLRGNFMTIMEMEVFKERDPNDARGQRVSGAGVKPEWQGRPNFKKFKKKDTRSERPKIALFSSSVEDTMGPSYWKGEKSQARTQPKPTATARSPPPPSDDEGQEEMAPVPVAKKRTQTQTQSRAPSRSRASSRARSVEPAPAPAKRAATRKNKAAPIIEESDEDEAPVQESQRSRRSRITGSQKSEALFLPDEEDENDGDDGAFKPHDFDVDMDDDVDAETSTLESKVASLPRRGGPTKKAAAPVRKPKRLVKDDSDDDAVFKGF